jgi:exopolysaccharide biosynthesis polyprenyl glycosylphosphotransferase
VPPLFVIVAKAMGLYDRDEHLLHKTTLEEVPALFGLATMATFLLVLAGDSLIDGALGRRQLLGTWLLLFLLLVCLRSAARGIARKLSPVERCLLVGDADSAQYVRDKLALSAAVKADLVGHVPPPKGLEDDEGNGNGHGPLELGPILAEQEIDRVILAQQLHRRDELLYIIRELKSYGVKVSVLPEASRVAGSSVELDHLEGLTLLGMKRFEFTRSSRLVKRSFDVVGATTALTLLSPLFLLITIAIRLDSSGPALFRQARIGRHGRRFEMLKFRSMTAEAEQLKEDLIHLNEGAEGLFKISDDPRVTRVGKLIRRWRVDELPQLWNVLIGQMSMVGPRPLIPEEDSKIEGWYRRRLDVPPGMTGHWQVLGSSEQIPLAEMVKLDYLYVANWSLWNDVKLLLRTFPFILRHRGV